MNADRPDTQLAISYALRGRDGIVALLAFDDRLAEIFAKANDPLVGQMRLTWWREAVEALDRAPPPAEPILRGLAEHALPRGITGASLAAIVDGWEALLVDPLDDAAMIAHAERGRVLFTSIARAIGARDAASGMAGEGWALADLSLHLLDPAARCAAAALARARLDAALRQRWSRAGRPLGALAHLARLDMGGHRRSPRRVFRLLFHRLTGH